MANFCSDNVTGAAPEILEALVRANEGAATAYGEDEATRRVEARLAEVFETELAAFPIATGSAANALGLAAVTPPYGAIYCHAEAHINVDECGAPEFYSAGAKLVPLQGDHAKIAPEALEAAIMGAGVVHHVQPAAVSLSQATESGTVYRPAEVQAIAEVARRHNLALQMDGARFANALVSLGCSPAEATWKAGVDVLTFGATKNGAFAAEAVVFFRPEQARDFAYRRKRGGHLFSKMRFISAQLEAYLTDELWLRNARRANAMAARLAAGLEALPRISLVHPVEANEIFARLPSDVAEGLYLEGFKFYPWGPEENGEFRLVTAFSTTEAEVDSFLDAVRRLTGAEARASA